MLGYCLCISSHIINLQAKSFIYVCKNFFHNSINPESRLDFTICKQDKELAAAAEKLAECQETIFLLGKQLKSFRPQSEFMGSPFSERSQRDECFTEDEPTISGMNLQESYQNELEGAVSGNTHRVGGESSIDMSNSPCSPSDADANLLRSPVNSKNPKHRSTGSFSSSSTPTPEKHQRGFSRFFSSKGKNGR